VRQEIGRSGNGFAVRLQGIRGPGQSRCSSSSACAPLSERTGSFCQRTVKGQLRSEPAVEQLGINSIARFPVSWPLRCRRNSYRRARMLNAVIYGDVK
jgi:hypothetical protein